MGYPEYRPDQPRDEGGLWTMGPGALTSMARTAVRRGAAGMRREGGEHVVGAAVQVEGRTFVGPSHDAAYKAAAAGLGQGVVRPRYHTGQLFVTNLGRVVDRGEAGAIAMRARQLRPGFNDLEEEYRTPEGNYALIWEDLTKHRSQKVGELLPGGPRRGTIAGFRVERPKGKQVLGRVAHGHMSDLALTASRDVGRGIRRTYSPGSLGSGSLA